LTSAAAAPGGLRQCRPSRACARWEWDAYPQIRPAGLIEVESVTLDALAANLGIPSSEFNLLHIDVQGAERLVLDGATETLPHMDAISVEVSFTDLYEGCAQIEDIEDKLRPLGFHRAALISAFHPSWGDAFYVRSRCGKQ
jgi:Methyltransferase FkbM domain